MAVLLLLVGMLLGGTVDAIACEPATEVAAYVTSITVSKSQSSDHKTPQSDHDGVCVHGHCHHGVSHVQPLATLIDLPAYNADHPLLLEHRLASIIPDALKRPPRA